VRSDVFHKDSETAVRASSRVVKAALLAAPRAVRNYSHLDYGHIYFFL
jgi:hypothetical protein